MYHRPLLFRKNTAFPRAALLFLVTAFCSCHSPEQGSAGQPGPPALLKSDTGESKIAALPGNVTVTLYANSSIYKAPDSGKTSRSFLLDGDAFFRVPPQSDTPFILHTGMLNLITRHAYFHVSAHRKDAGQSVKLLRGELRAEKAYPSDYPDTETLHAGDMVMINKDIDLMEKETFDTATLSPRTATGKKAK